MQDEQKTQDENNWILLIKQYHVFLPLLLSLDNRFPMIPECRRVEKGRKEAISYSVCLQPSRIFLCSKENFDLKVSSSCILIIKFLHSFSPKNGKPKISPLTHGNASAYGSPIKYNFLKSLLNSESLNFVFKNVNIIYSLT